MLKSRNGLLSLAVALLLLAPALPSRAGALRQSGAQTFPQTGKTVSGKFLQYWNAHGGLAQLGLPISDEMPGVSPANGKTYTLQYFERAVLEQHPEYAGTPFEIEGALLGVFDYTSRYPNATGAPGQKASTDNPFKFAETGKTLGGRFRSYWETHGGLALNGYPITDEFQQVSAQDGKTYTVQYFERAVYELHPGNQAPNDVLLAQLGTFQWQAHNDLSYTDFTKTKVTLTKRPERIVCLVSLCEDILFVLGIQPVGVTDTFSQFPQFWGDTARSFPAIGGGFGSPNLEDIAKAKPDLVIGFIPHIGLRDALKSIAPLYIMNPASYQDSIEYLLTMGRLTDREYQAQRSAQEFLHKLAAYKAKSPNNKVPLLIFGPTLNFSIFTAGSLFGSVLAEATNYPWPPPSPGQAGSADQEPGSLQYSVEKILEKDPDVLLVESFNFAPGSPSLSQMLTANPVWSQLKAVQTGQVYEVNTNFYLFGRGTRSMEIALDDAMHKIYPDTFPQPLP